MARVAAATPPVSLSDTTRTRARAEPLPAVRGRCPRRCGRRRRLRAPSLGARAAAGPLWLHGARCRARCAPLAPWPPALVLPGRGGGAAAPTCSPPLCARGRGLGGPGGPGEQEGGSQSRCRVPSPQLRGERDPGLKYLQTAGNRHTSQPLPATPAIYSPQIIPEPFLSSKPRLLWDKRKRENLLA